jgi:hypothetical protein
MTFLQNGKVFEDHVEIGFRLRFVYEAAHAQVLPDRELRKYAPSLRHISDPSARPLIGPFRGDVDVVEGDATAANRQEADDGAHQARLADAVAPENGHDFTRFDSDAHASQDIGGVVAGDDLRGG